VEPPYERSRPRPATNDAGGPVLDLDARLARFEDVLLELPYDRAVPEIGPLLARAGLDPEVLLHERARKVLHEALLARPFGTLDEVVRVRTEVELLTLEVEVLVDRLTTARSGGDAAAVAELGTRLVSIRRRLDEVRDQL
jgi:hypothetical protein